MASRRWTAAVWLVGAIGAAACSNPSTATSPVPVPQITGPYTFSVYPASNCTGDSAISYPSFSWPVTAAFENNSNVYVVHFNLPASPPTLAITLTYNTNALNPAVAQGSISTPIPQLSSPPGVPITGTPYNFNTTAPLTGTVVAGTDGRGIVESGTLVGDIEVINQQGQIVESCQSSTHLWTLLEVAP